MSNHHSSNKSRDTHKAEHIVVAGAIAAFTVDLLIYPLDTLKTRIQSKEYARVYAGRANRRVLWRGLYQGVGSVIVATIPSSAAFFTTYEFCKSTLHRTHLLPEPIIHGLSSSTGELISCAILTPAEVLKQNAQTLRLSSSSSSPHSATSSSLSRGLLNHGASTSLRVLKPFLGHPRDLFRGYFALVGRNLPFTAMQFPVYEALKKRWSAGSRGGEKVGTGKDVWKTVRINSMAGVCAGSIAAVITTPVDVVKTRVMLDAGECEQKQPGGRGADTHSSRRYSRVVKDILSESGFRGLWRGVWLRGTWSGLGLGVYLGTYEGGKVWLRGKQEERERVREGMSL